MKTYEFFKLKQLISVVMNQERIKYTNDYDTFRIYSVNYRIFLIYIRTN